MYGTIPFTIATHAFFISFCRLLSAICIRWIYSSCSRRILVSASIIRFNPFSKVHAIYGVISLIIDSSSRLNLPFFLSHNRPTDSFLPRAVMSRTGVFPSTTHSGLSPSFSDDNSSIHKSSDPVMLNTSSLTAFSTAHTTSSGPEASSGTAAVILRHTNRTLLSLSIYRLLRILQNLFNRIRTTARIKKPSTTINSSIFRRYDSLSSAA